MGKARHWLALGVVGLALQAGGALASVTLWDNGGPASAIPGGSLMAGTVQAEDFTLGFATNLSSVSFWSLQGGSTDYAGSIYYQIVGNSTGQPGTTVYGSGQVTPTRTATGNSVSGYTEYRNDFAVAISNLAAGTYWLELNNGPLGTTTLTDFYWDWTDVGGINSASNRGQEMETGVASAFTTNDAEHAFLITGDRVVIVPPPNGTPEPASLALTGAALALLALRRRRAA